MEQSMLDAFVGAIKQDTNEKKTTYSAIVSKVDDEGIIWVYVAGSEKETPTAQTGVEVKKGDNVTVEWRNNKLYIAGNYSNPAAGVTRVQEAETSAKVANEAAESAVKDAGRARDAANSAQESATEAKRVAEDVETIAIDAQTAADNAQASADTAFTQLSIVENIVGVLELIAKHGEYAPATEDEVNPDKWYFNKKSDGTYEVVNNPSSVYHLTADTTVGPNKTYYTRSGAGTEADPYVYAEVEEPTGSPVENNYYEKYYTLIGIDKAIQNYISSHLALVGDTLSLRTNCCDYQLNMTANGIEIFDNQNNVVVAQYGVNSIIGALNDFHIVTGKNSQNVSEIGFYKGLTKLAYMNGAELYVTNSLAFGHFTFVERTNGHFTLKLIH